MGVERSAALRPALEQAELLATLRQREASGRRSGFVGADPGGGRHAALRRRSMPAPTAVATPAERWPRAARVPRSGRRARRRRRTCRSVGRRCRSRPTANGRRRAPTDRGPAAAARRWSAPPRLPARRARCGRSSHRPRTTPALRPPPRIDTRPTPTATSAHGDRRVAQLRLNDRGGRPDAIAVQATARGRAVRNPSPTSTRPSRRTSWTTAMSPTPVTSDSASHRSLRRSSRLAPSSIQPSSPATTSGPRASASSTVSPAEPKNVSDGTCSGATAGRRIGTSVGSQAMEHAVVVARPAATATGSTWRASRGRSSVPTAPTARTTAVTSRPTPRAPSRPRSIGGSAACIASPTTVAAVTAAAMPMTRRPSRPTVRRAASDDTGADHGNEAGGDPEPRAGGSVVPGITTGRRANVACQDGSDGRRRRRREAPASVRRRTLSSHDHHPRRGPGGPPC